ncbi:MAG: putative potassium transport system protein kup 1 [Acidimicrobiia bacterium]|nr:MAG: putative potassium transport system protein kup 1 [Acidimicrobiia bacterium]
MSSPVRSRFHPGLAGLALAALGVVYGDIGTSPLYAFREAIRSGLEPTPAVALGVASLVLWSLIVVISIKYIGLVMRADNDGEGGLLALTALARDVHPSKLLLLLGLFGTALLYGDGAITPAISVLAAVEGLDVVLPDAGAVAVPAAAVILVGLFALQRRGTAAVGSLFGPVMVVWFATIGFLGIRQIVGHPDVLAAFSPTYAVGLFVDRPLAAFRSLGSVFLVVTGGEALYADMGHFGPRPIRLAWFGLVLPGLALNYLGQAALVISDPSAVDSPFFRMAPAGWVLPLVGLATLATVIASQALISGAFSLTAQAVQLDYLPRMEVRHTSATERGQVYVPAINWTLMAVCLGLVVGFGSSSNLAGAYGVAVTATMAITTVLLGVVARRGWGWPVGLVFVSTVTLLVVDLSFFGANLLKIASGGWFPLVAGGAVFTVMTTWRKGREVLYGRMRRGEAPLSELVESVLRDPPERVPGTAVYLFPEPDRVPPALLVNLRANHSLHETVIVVSVKVTDRPRVLPAARSEVTPMGDGFYQVVLRYGFADRIDVAADLANLEDPPADPAYTVYFVGRERVRSTAVPSDMARWRERLFAVLHRNAASAADFFRLPPDRVVEIGAPVTI